MVDAEGEPRPLHSAKPENLTPAHRQELETFDASVEAVCELVYCTASGGQPEAPMLPLVQRLVPAVRRGAQVVGMRKACTLRKPYASSPCGSEGFVMELWLC